MELEIHNQHISRFSLTTSIIFSASILSEYNIEFPHLVTGTLLCNGHQVSILQPLFEQDSEIDIKEITSDEQQKNYREKRKSRTRLSLVAELNRRKIDFIEEERLKNAKKSAILSLRLSIGVIRIPTVNNNITQSTFNVKFYKLHSTIEISQVDWMEKFSPFLGIGEFYIIELIKPTFDEQNIWSELYDNLNLNLNQMEEQLKIGDWQRTIEISRRFFENIKIGDGKRGHKKYKDDLTNRMKKLQFDEVGIQNLFDGIWQFFEFTSKFIHEKRNGEPKPIPHAKKEDAYFIYSLALNLTNLIFEKIKSSG